MAEPLRLLVVDDEPNMLRMLRVALEEEGYAVETCERGEEVLPKLEETPFDLVLTDVRMPGMDGLELLRHCRRIRPETPVLLMTAHGSMDLAVQAMKDGAIDVIQKPFGIDEIRTRLARALHVRDLETENRRLRATVHERFGLERIVGSSAPMQRVLEQVRQVASARSTIMITGESGTGKELVAKAIHELSPRSGQAFVKVNCAALPENLLESELFGHEKGAFTGATASRKGRFELADGGTIFLDEIGDTTPSLQTKLLRVLQEQEFERVGGTKTLRVDARVIAATNRDLRRAVEEGSFREDLYFRLHVIPIELPPLRERGEDVLLLAAAFLSKIASESGKKVEGFEPTARQALARYPWPGNVRELQNAVERAVVLSRGPLVRLADLPEPVQKGQALFRRAGEESATDGKFVLPAEGIQLEAWEEDLLLQALERTKGNQSQAARLLGLTRNAFRYRLGEMKKVGKAPARLVADDAEEGA